MKYFFTLAFSLITLAAFCQQETINWKFEAKKTAPQTYKIKATASIEEGWYVYSQYLESDEGPIATYWSFDEEESSQRLGEPSEEGKKVTGWDELFDMTITKYKQKMVLEQVIKVPKGQRYAKGSITFMSCNDRQCMPPRSVNFEVKLPR